MNRPHCFTGNRKVEVVDLYTSKSKIQLKTRGDENPDFRGKNTLYFAIILQNYIRTHFAIAESTLERTF